MAIEHLHDFLQNYFTAHNCELVHNQDGILTVQLTEKMDRALMNRPFYWHYVKSTGFAGEPMKLTLITNPDRRDDKGEWIHFGSPRLQQLFAHLHDNEKFTKLFQKIDTTKKTALYPWLVINIKISYIGKQKRDEIISIGLHLVNGMMKTEMMEYLKTIPLQMTISDYCFTISPLIKVKSGFKRIEAVLENYIENQTYEWADESLKTLNEEIDLLKHFYSDRMDEENLDNKMEQELNEITNRYQPHVLFNVINGGIFYLTDDPTLTIQ
ncbi:YqhG family protein [Virgibacillus ndiopensis]|uniref:YqhG family protein n=1 Tax=Virgibacillus ndiopensis TaxID=2004408 RepID=UPI000C0848E5|nr:YqhG family protein [Virgibacillus ndiopensis]